MHGVIERQKDFLHINPTTTEATAAMDAFGGTNITQLADTSNATDILDINADYAKPGSCKAECHYCYKVWHTDYLITG